MAIIIPSKSIYSVENPKIRDNIINRIDLDCTQPTSPYVAHDNNVYSATKTINNNNLIFPHYEIKSHNSKATVGGNAQIGITEGYYYDLIGENIWYSSLSDSIYRFKDNYYIQKINLGIKKQIVGDIFNATTEEVKNIQTTISYTIKETQFTHRLENAYNNTNGEWEESKIKNLDYWYNLASSENSTYKTTSSEVLDTRVKFPLRYNDDLVLKDNSTINNENILEETIDNININYSFLTKTKKITLVGYFTKTSSQTYPNYIDANFEVRIQEIIPQTLQINIKGTTLGIDLNDTTLQYGNGDKPFKVDNNELIQTTNFLSSTNENALESQYTNLLEQYKNGKEYAVINCSISEYKDQDGNVVINPKESGKMLFDMYDIVIPYKQGFVNGVQQDVPLSKYPNGEPKQFQVLGVKPHTNGVLRQELTLQEISQSTLQNK